MKPMYELIDNTVYVPVGCDPWNHTHCHDDCHSCGKPNKPSTGDANDAKITLKQGNVELGSFTLNQDKDQVITIPEPGNGIVIIKQGGVEKGTFTLNQDGSVTIDLDAGGGVGPVTKEYIYHGYFGLKGAYQEPFAEDIEQLTAIELNTEDELFAYEFILPVAGDGSKKYYWFLAVPKSLTANIKDTGKLNGVSGTVAIGYPPVEKVINGIDYILYADNTTTWGNTGTGECKIQLEKK
jgi:hypothetical protein